MGGRRPSFGSAPPAGCFYLRSHSVINRVAPPFHQAARAAAPRGMPDQALRAGSGLEGSRALLLEESSKDLKARPERATPKGASPARPRELRRCKGLGGGCLACYAAEAAAGHRIESLAPGRVLETGRTPASARVVAPAFDPLSLGPSSLSLSLSSPGSAFLSFSFPSLSSSGPLRTRPGRKTRPCDAS